MEHHTYIDLVRTMVNSGWGRGFDSEKEALKSIGSPMELPGACMLSIVNTIDTIMDALTTGHFEEKVKHLRQEGRKKVKLFIDERAKTHGPCPEVVKCDLIKQVNTWIGSQLLLGVFPSWVHCPEPPKKGTDARKAYNSWMKNKIAK